MAITASKLRENVYAVLDQVIETGVPVEIRRKGALLRIGPDKPRSKLSRLKKRDCIIGDPQDLVHMNWLDLWSERK
jgi:hypothetical protein